MKKLNNYNTNTVTFKPDTVRIQFTEKKPGSP